MSYDPRSAGASYPGVAYPVTVTNTPDPRSAWLAVGVMGMLTMQFMVLVLIAWKLLFGQPGAAAVNTVGQSRPAEQGVQSNDRLLGQQWQAQRADAQLRLLNQVVQALDEDAPKNLVLLLEKERLENEQLLADVRAYRALESKANKDNQKLGEQLADAEHLTSSLRSQVRTLDQTLADAKVREAKLEARIEKLEDELTTATGEEQSTEAGGLAGLRSAPWWLWFGGGAVLVIVVGASYALFTIPREGRVSFESAADDADEPDSSPIAEPTGDREDSRQP